MGFMNSMKNTLDNDYNVSITENGAVGFRTTGKELMDINFKVASLRNASEEEIIKSFERAFAENKLYAIKWLFYLRDAREGLGERRTFRVIIRHMANVEPVIGKALVNLIAEYGRFDDLLYLFDTECSDDVLSYIKGQLELDKKNMADNKPVSLLAKWLPSCNASSVKTRQYGTIVRNYLGCSEKAYRKTLSELRKYIDIVERKMSSGEWDKINYETVPSKANLIYKDAFMKNDESRRTEYLESLQRGEVKINSSVNFPHDIVHSYTKGSSYGFNGKPDTTLEELWKALPDLVKENGNTLFVRDGSGSMCLCVDSNSRVTALEIATALAIYFSEKCSGEFKDKFITFSSRPSMIDLSKIDTLAGKIRRCFSEDDCSNTDIEKTFDLILDTAIKGHMKQEDLPKNVLIVSDMEFDYATTTGGYGYYGRRNAVSQETLFQTIEDKFNKAGYKLPRLVFWNVNSRTETIPVKENALGVALVSGFSVNIVKMVLSGKLDPYECLIEQLDAERYTPVENAVKNVIQ